MVLCFVLLSQLKPLFVHVIYSIVISWDCSTWEESFTEIALEIHVVWCAFGMNIFHHKDVLHQLQYTKISLDTVEDDAI